MCGCLLSTPYWGPGIQTRHVLCDSELNQLPFGSQTSTQSTQSHQPGHHCIFSKNFVKDTLSFISIDQEWLYFCNVSVFI